MSKLTCVNEAIGEDGSKIMEFTKGKEYEYTGPDYEGCFEVADDNGRIETFFNIDLMFTGHDHD